MKISTRGRYALRIMTDLAMNNDDSFISLKDISSRQQISMKYLEQIISLLNKAGYLDSLRGINGGYKLNRKPSEYRIGDILIVYMMIVKEKKYARLIIFGKVLMKL